MNSIILRILTEDNCVVFGQVRVYPDVVEYTSFGDDVFDGDYRTPQDVLIGARTSFFLAH